MCCRRHLGSGRKVLSLVWAFCLAAGAIAALVLAASRSGSEPEAWAAPLPPSVAVTTPLTAAPVETGRGAACPNCRIGAAECQNPVVSYTISSLGLGWYLNWGTMASPPSPGGMEYVQMVRVSGSGYSPSGSTLADLLAANPGSLWLVGNEPDCIYQDNALPQEYATAYHDSYTFIKSHDPSALVAVGGIVQPTPLRIAYLDAVLDSYLDLYGQVLPTDVWHIHTFILREASCDVYPDSCWGCEIPPGITADHGELYELDDTDDLGILQQRIFDFREWMSNKGYRDTPLIVTEMGTLLPYYEPEALYYDSQGNPFDEARARDFMYGVFGFFLQATDADVGYPPDENRLVQRWMWYSVDDTTYGGALFDPVTLLTLTLGTDMASYVGAITPTVDLLAVEVGQAGSPPYSPEEPVTLTLRVRLSNVGNISTTQPITARFVDGLDQQIGADQVITEPIRGCAGVVTASVVWPNVAPGAHVVCAVIDPDDRVSEANEGNNQVCGVALVAKERSFLSLVLRQAE
jgi:hypothetical protein